MNDKPDTRFRRLPRKGSRDLALACQIVDAARVCHVGFSQGGQSYVIPMAIARDGLRILLHGSIASRAMKALASGAPCCVTVTHFDGLVLARSAFNSSMNYRCVMIFGTAVAISEIEEKARGLDVMTEHLMPGRLAEIRPSTRKELNATMLLALPIETYTVKVSNGPPDDPRKDLSAPVWAGVLPLQTKAGKPQNAPDLEMDISLPGYLKRWRFG
jgi:nitroimidazol reductase NimA-like FMN-containing flavoprotein (pyridoxamine 5'-phosphate oxidase superfamily)